MQFRIICKCGKDMKSQYGGNGPKGFDFDHCCECGNEIRLIIGHSNPVYEPDKMKIE